MTLATRSFLLANSRLVMPRIRTKGLRSLGLNQESFDLAIVVSSHILITSTFFLILSSDRLLNYFII